MKLDGEQATPSVEFRIDVTHAGEKVKTPSVPLLAPTTIAEAPTLSLKDLVPEHDQHDLDGHGQPESFKTDRIEFVIVERELDEAESGASNQSDRECGRSLTGLLSTLSLDKQLKNLRRTTGIELTMLLSLRSAGTRGLAYSRLDLTSWYR